MIEIHPFGDFVPEKVKYLMLGSFVTKPSNPTNGFMQMEGTSFGQ